MFPQLCLGKDEKIFSILKFKTISCGMDANGKLLPDEDKITKFGIFLRKTYLDEIPQLINIIKENMNLIDPKPLKTSYLPCYTKEESMHLSIRPGITGLAQISGRSLLEWDRLL